MMLAPHAIGLVSKAPFVAFSETLGAGVYSFTPQSRAPGATKVRFRLRGGGGGAGTTGTPNQSGGGGGGGEVDTGLLTFAPADLTTTISITVGAGGALEVNGVGSSLTASFVAPVNLLANGGLCGLNAIGGAGGSASGGAINTPGDPGQDAINEPPWVVGSGGAPNGGTNGAGGNGQLIIDWS